MKTSRTLLGFTAALLLSCASGNQVTGPPRVWPPSPAEPQVQFEQAVYGTADVGYSFWQKVQNFIFGRPDEEHMGKPYGICVDGDRWYVADTGRDRILVFDWDARRVWTFGELDAGRHLIEPVNVAVGPDGKIYVADTGLKRVIRFREDGTFETIIGSDAELESPVGLAWDTAANLLVVDSKRHHVAVYDSGQAPVTTFGQFGDQPGEFYYPLGIATTPDGSIYVVDAFHFTVQRFDAQYQYLGDFGHDERAAARLPRPRAVAVDSAGRLYVTDALRQTVVVFDSTGNVLFTFGNEGTGDGEFRLPAGIALGDGGAILVVDSLNHRILKFQLVRG